ncbi:hypothetical protein D3C78_1271740 [compost metagenome]
MVLAFLRRLLVPILALRGTRRKTPPQRLAQRIDQRAAAVMLYVILERRRVVVDMHIGVDHGVIQPRFHGE